MTGPDPNSIYPNENIRQVVYIKNVISRPNILVGDYTYYDDIDGAEKFEEHVTHHYDFLSDRLIIGKFCAIARGIEFIMNGANHRMNSVTTYPFNIMGGGWEKFAPKLDDLPLKGDHGVLFNSANAMAAVLILLLIGGSRLAWRLFLNHPLGERLRGNASKDPNRPVMIVGAGEAGAWAINVCMFCHCLVLLWSIL